MQLKTISPKFFKEMADKSDDKMYYLLEAQEIFEELNVTSVSEEMDRYDSHEKDLVQPGHDGLFTSELEEWQVPLSSRHIDLEYQGNTIRLSKVQVIENPEEQILSVSEHYVLNGERTDFDTYTGDHFGLIEIKQFLQTNHESTTAFWQGFQEFDIFETLFQYEETNY